MMVIKQAVERLDCLEASYSHALLHVGAKHRNYKEFCIENFSLFKESILFVWKQVLKEKLLPDGQEAWETLLDYIILGLSYGFMINPRDVL